MYKNHSHAPYTHLYSEGVIDLLVEVEARIDFEEDLGPLDAPAARARVAELQGEIEAALRTARQGALLRNGLQVSVLVGLAWLAGGGGGGLC